MEGHVSSALMFADVVMCSKEIEELCSLVNLGLVREYVASAKGGT